MKFSWTTTSQSIENNSSVVSWKMELIATGAGKIISSASKSWSVTINGSSYSGTNSIAISNNTTKTLASGSVTIAHNSDGSKSFDYSFSQQFSMTFGGVSIGTKSGSGSGTLDTIARASQPSLSVASVNMGSAVTIYTNRASSSFTHTLTYKFGNTTGTIATGVGENYAWTPALSLANQVPSATSGTGTITCQTYNGSTLIGTKTVNITLNVPSSVVPSISSITVSAGNSVVPSTWGVYLQGKSSLKVVTSASGSYSSSITSYKVTGIDNNIYYSSNFTSGILQITGTRTITVTVTDSRGRTATKTTSYTCVAYNGPTISVATVTRCNSDGTANEEGIYVKYSFAANVAAVSNKNTYAYKIGYKSSSSSSYTYITISNSAYSLNKSAVISGVTFSVDNSYDFQFFVSDYFSSTTVVKNIGTGFTLVDYRATGKGMAIGKVSERDAFEVALDMYDKYGGVVTSRITKSITITGDASYYYPVVITLSSSKEMPQRISIWKNLGTQTASYSGNHSNGTSSLWLTYEGRNVCWDGNGGYFLTKYKSQPYATLVSNTTVETKSNGNMIIWLRGGGTLYNISSDYNFEAVVYYSNTNIGTSSYPTNVEPRTDIGNGGIYSSAVLGYGNISGNASTATNATNANYATNSNYANSAGFAHKPVGEVMITSSNTNPNNLGYTGTWTLIDKEFSSGDNIGSFTVNSTNCSASDYDFSRGGHTLFFSGGCTAKIQWNDDTIQVGTINFSACGVSRLGADVYFVGYTDAGNSGLMFDLDYSTGSLSIVDNFGDSYISAGRACKWSCAVTVPMAYMLDSACDKFYWKRTA